MITTSGFLYSKLYESYVQQMGPMQSQYAADNINHDQIKRLPLKYEISIPRNVFCLKSYQCMNLIV